MVQQITFNGDSPRYLFGAATPLRELSTPGFANRQMSLTPDGIEAFFVRQTFDAGTDLRTSSEIFAARRASTSDPFGTPQRVAELIPPATYGDNGPSISADGLSLYIRYFHLDPPGWAFTTSHVVFNNLTSRAFPSTNLGYAGVNNAGATGADGGPKGKDPERSSRSAVSN
jgi:hypothetical protein